MSLSHPRPEDLVRSPAFPQVEASCVSCRNWLYNVKIVCNQVVGRLWFGASGPCDSTGPREVLGWADEIPN